MYSLIASAQAQTTETAPTPAGGGDMFSSMIPLVMIFGVFYLLLLRPQQKRLKQHQEMTESLSKGDQVILGSGVYGVIMKIEGSDATVRIAEGVEIKVLRSSIAEQTGDKSSLRSGPSVHESAPKAEAPAAHDKKKKKK